MNEQFARRSKRRSIMFAFVIIATLVILVGVFKLGQLSGAKEFSKNLVSPSPVATPLTSDTPSPSPTPSTEPYKDCDEVWDELGRPITSDDEGFPESSPNEFDLDSDGIGCEDDPNTPDIDESEIDWESIWSRTKENGQEFGDYVGPKLKSFWADYGDPAVGTLEEELQKLFK